MARKSKYSREGKRKKRKGLRKLNRRISLPGSSFFQIPDPFGEADTDTRVQIADEIAKASAEKYEKELDRIQRILKDVDPLQILAQLANYGLLIGMSEEGKLSKPKGQSIQQSDVEIAQALALRVYPEEQSYLPPSPEQFQELMDALITISQAYDFRKLSEVKKAKSEEEKSLGLIQASLRVKTHLVRNWGHLGQVISISRRLYSRLDSSFENLTGVKATVLIAAFEKIIKLVEERANNRFNEMKPVLSGKNVEQVVRNYYKTFPTLRGSPEEVIQEFKSHNVSLDMARVITLSHHNLNLYKDYLISVPDLANELQVGSAKLGDAFQRLSHSFGELKDTNIEYFFLDNPIWQKPLIRIDDNTYFCSIPQIFFSFIFKILDGLIATDEEKARRISIERSNLLEDEVVSAFTRAFPESVWIRNFKWMDSGSQYETDLLIKVDSYVFIVESKSGRVSESALRGAPKRLERDINELLIGPSLQSRRLESKILKIKLSQESDEHFVRNLPFSLHDIHQVLRFSITLEDFAAMQTNFASLKETGWIGQDFVSTPTMTLADLECIFDILETIPQRIHYFVRRSEIEGFLDYEADEIDLLGFYLNTNFDLPDTKPEGAKFLLTNSSSKIDEYYTAFYSQKVGKKPVLRMTPWWNSIQIGIQQRRFPRWSEAAVMLLNVSYKKQIELEKYFQVVRANVRSNWEKPGVKRALVVALPKGQQYAFIIMAFRELEKDQRYEFIKNIVQTAFIESCAERCMVIAINIDLPAHPYSLIGVYDRTPSVGSDAGISSTASSTRS